MTSLQCINTHSLGPTSEDPEGISPTASCNSNADVVEFYSGYIGSQQHCAQLQRPQKRGAVRWLVRSIHRLQGKQHEQGVDCGLPSGNSYDSLSGLDGVADGSWSSWQQRQQQQSAPTVQDLVCARPSSHTAISTLPVAASQPSEGLVRRIAKAVLRPVVHLISKVVAHVGPQGPGSNDNSAAERIVNVLTSIPFCVIGAYGLRRRRCVKGRHFSLSFMAVGVVAATYHSARLTSPLRPWLRKLDYYTICYTSSILRRAAHIKLPTAVNLAALLVAPVKPTAVTGLNLALVESKFLRQAITHAHLRPSFKLHLGSALVGMGFFAFEDIATTMGWPAVLHSLWHCLSAVAMGCTNSLLQHLEMLLLMEGVQLQAA